MLRAVIALLVLLVPSVAQAEGRSALLIGNQAYNPKVGPLKNPFGLALYDREQRNVGVPGARGQVASERREQPLDSAFTPAQRIAPTTSQRAIAAVRRPNSKGMVADVGDVPV